jgi:hypothetical protein
MKLLLPLGLLVSLMVVGPLLAHLLRRSKPLEREFPPARLAMHAPAVARRRAQIEDRALLSLRALAVIALSLLAASPLVRCTQLSLDRRGGASIAMVLVIDDSMSMRANLPAGARRGGASTRFGLAMVAARELASSLARGDAAAIVLAGAPSRLVLPPSNEPGAFRAAIDQIALEGPSDRATDLDGALALAASTIRELPQPDKRVVLLSDGSGDGPAPISLAGAPGVRLDAPLDALRSAPPEGSGDCAVLLATPESDGAAVRVRLACADAPIAERAIEIRSGAGGTERIARVALPPNVPRAPATFEVVATLDEAMRGKWGKQLGANPGRTPIVAALVGPRDAIESDDVAPLLGEAAAPSIACVSIDDGHDGALATGGPPVIERALAALQSGLAVRALPAVPDREIDLEPFAGLVIDDPPAFGPEARGAIRTFLEGGGVLLLGLGPRAASPPLGANFDGLLAHGTRWERVSGPLGIDPAMPGAFGDGAQAATDLKPTARTVFDREDLGEAAPTARFSDQLPLALHRQVGRGEAWIVALPFDVERSDLPLRPGFLAMLDAFVARVRELRSGARIVAGTGWTFATGTDVDARALDLADGQPRGKPLPLERDAEPHRVVPSTIGLYAIETKSQGRTLRELRAVAPDPREVDLTPRPLTPTAAVGGQSSLARTSADLSPTVVLLLVALIAVELVVRIVRRLRPPRELEDDAVS